LRYNGAQGLKYFLTTQYTNNPNRSPSGYYDYYYSGSADSGSNYYFLEDTTGNTNGYSRSNYFAFMPPDQQFNQQYSQYGVFWLYNGFRAGDGNIYIFLNEWKYI
jgi:hypothetical protein